MQQDTEKIRNELSDDAASNGSRIGIWDRARNTWDELADRGQKATERVVDSFEELGGTTRLRFLKSRLERDLQLKLAELGGKILEVSRHGSAADPARMHPLEAPEIAALLVEIDELDTHVRQLEVVSDGSDL